METNWLPLLLTAILVAAAIFGIIRLSRGRALRRWKAVLDAYADQETPEPTFSRRGR
jgi:hypothetical protein